MNYKHHPLAKIIWRELDKITYESRGVEKCFWDVVNKACRYHEDRMKNATDDDIIQAFDCLKSEFYKLREEIRIQNSCNNCGCKNKES